MFKIIFKKHNRKLLFTSIFYSLLLIFIIGLTIFLSKSIISPNITVFNIKVSTVIHVTITSLIFIFFVVMFYFNIKTRSNHIGYVKQKLSRNENKFKNIFKKSPIMMFSLNSQAKVIEANNKLLSVTGYSKHEIIDNEFNIILNNSADNILNSINSMNEDNSIEDYETIVKCKNGAFLTVLLDINKYYNDNGDPVWLCVLRNITDQRLISRERENLIKRLELSYEKAREANKLKTEFLAIVTHELKTPITSMLGFSEIINNDNTLSNEIRNIGSVIKRSSKKLLEILSEIIELSMIEAGKVQNNKETFYAKDIINDIYSFISDLLDSKKINFRVENFANFKIFSDKHKLRQIFYNVINNAIKYTDEGNVILKNISNMNEYVFQIIDSGIGINKDKESIIFEMFRQAEDVFRRKYGGVGLGLTISKKLVESLGGKIWFNNNDAQGCTFNLSIPRDIKMEKLTSDADTIDSNFKRLKSILIADDDENTTIALSSSKINIDFCIKDFDDGDKLLFEYKNNPNYDLILLDIQMPKMNGIECLFEIRKINKNIPVIAITSYSTKETNNLKEKYKLLGFTDYIKKPFNTNELQEKISTYI